MLSILYYLMQALLAAHSFVLIGLGRVLVQAMKAQKNKNSKRNVYCAGCKKDADIVISSP